MCIRDRLVTLGFTHPTTCIHMIFTSDFVLDFTFEIHSSRAQSNWRFILKCTGIQPAHAVSHISASTTTRKHEIHSCRDPRASHIAANAHSSCDAHQSIRKNQPGDTHQPFKVPALKCDVPTHRVACWVKVHSHLFTTSISD